MCDDAEFQDKILKLQLIWRGTMMWN